MTKNKLELVILDRDGVINQNSNDYIKSADEWQPITGSFSAIAKLCQAKIKVAIASNQAGIVRGKFKQQDLTEMHEKMLKLAAQNSAEFACIKYCTDAPDSNSHMRKPNPGMLLEIMQELQVNHKSTVFIGDSYTDYLAAKNAKCKFILVKTGHGEETLKQHPELWQSIAIYANLADCVKQLLTK